MPNANVLNSQLIGQALAECPGPDRIHVGFSGGLDSTVLLHLVYRWWCQLPPHRRPPLQAIHVNHQLHAEAPGWRNQCVALCQQWSIPCVTRDVTVDRAASSLEQQARRARYQVFHELVQPSEVLLLAHHRDDQVETLLQRLARGSGPLGLGAMTAHSRRHGFHIVRPLLDWDRLELETYAREHHLHWVEDPSNQDESLERNFIRRRLLPLWRSRRAELNQTLARSARLCNESALLLDDLAALDLGGARPDGGLPLVRLQTLSTARQHNLLRFWLRELGIPLPSAVVLQRIASEVASATTDAQPLVTWGQASVRRFQGVLYGLGQPLPEAGSDPIVLPTVDTTVTLPWGQWRATGSPLPFSRQALSGKTLSIQFRAGGERLKLPGRPGKSLKDLFQEAAVPPWLRGLWPILYADGRIAGLPGLWVCEDYTPVSEADRVCFHWQRPGCAQD
ncbi:tRNA lysidine(34) synthetase TilS [Ketobacter sp.]|uniref:tRNA lysidine(34) synthetase TilS n=1 Tax=Ketobacter sp. TaxID=2083498 RepID=UPI000F2AC46E|nr:tRNA lysidine(34) synthetase TilS [Ketobacter sp.]RLT92629.1 MAG: tRNA lysidine(34) synthetase TilS [Ketobacter sp.]